MKYDFTLRLDIGQVMYGVDAIAETARARKALKAHPGGRYFDQDWRFGVAGADRRVPTLGSRKDAIALLESEFPGMTVDPYDGLECWTETHQEKHSSTWLSLKTHL